MDAPNSSFGEVLPDTTPELLAWARRRFEELDEAVTGSVAARCASGATRVAAHFPFSQGRSRRSADGSPTLGGRSGSGGSRWIALGYDPLRLVLRLVSVRASALDTDIRVLGDRDPQVAGELRERSPQLRLCEITVDREAVDLAVVLDDA